MRGVVVQGPLLRGPRARHKGRSATQKSKGVTVHHGRISKLSLVSEVRLTAVGCAQLSDKG